MGKDGCCGGGENELVDVSTENTGSGLNAVLLADTAGHIHAGTAARPTVRAVVRAAHRRRFQPHRQSRLDCARLKHRRL